MLWKLIKFLFKLVIRGCVALLLICLFIEVALFLIDDTEIPDDFQSVSLNYTGDADLSSMSEEELFEYFLSNYDDFDIDGEFWEEETVWANDGAYWDEGQGELVQNGDEIAPGASGKASDLLTYCNSYLGVPYVYGGSSRSGMDCSGFVTTVYKDALGIKLPRSAHEIFRKAKQVDDSDLAPGDLVFFSASGSRISHVGIFLGDGKFIHAASDGPKTGVIVSRLSESYWSRTYVGGGTVI